MSGAYCKDPKVDSPKLGDIPCVFNPFGKDWFDWEKAFPSKACTAGTVFLYLCGAAFIGAAMSSDPAPDEVLGYMLIFTGLQFIPYIVALVLMNGPNPIKGLLLNFVYRPDLPPVGIEGAAWAKRSAAAQKENTTAMVIFAPAVFLYMIRHSCVDTPCYDDIKGAAMGFLIARTVHYVFLVGPIGSPQPIPVIPTVSFLAR
mmetsp:Transcript_58175/g.161135  ORF Transcript_58175/g.161135 Transcript_58175/m.161135 type:complete len:201 (-) Transcript_58175:548-1150(-)